MLGTPNLTPNQHGRSYPQSPQGPSSNLSTLRSDHTHSPCLWWGPQLERGTGAQTRNRCGASLSLRAEGSFKMFFSLLCTSCQCLTLAKLQRSLFEIKSRSHMHSWLNFSLLIQQCTVGIFIPTKETVQQFSSPAFNEHLLCVLHCMLITKGEEDVVKEMVSCYLGTVSLTGHSFSLTLSGIVLIYPHCEVGIANPTSQCSWED